MAKLEGGCVCGGTRYVLHAEPGSLGDCHCVDCRRSSGAPYVTWGTVARSDLEIVRGGLRKIDHAGRVRSFAACCGTPLFFEDSPTAPTIDIAIATLDDPSPYPPRKVIWLEDKLPWVKLDPALPTFMRSGAVEPER